MKQMRCFACAWQKLYLFNMQYSMFICHSMLLHTLILKISDGEMGNGVLFYQRYLKTNQSANTTTLQLVLCTEFRTFD